ncbi:arginase family protein, partial [Paenibacillus sp. 7516]|uniref:arginase family protein n=1 Tax=Paenibacillus sp. 7516 TaxID=2022549 RepID=UPI000BC83352
MDIIDTNLIEVIDIDIDNDVYTLQNKKNNKIVKLNKGQLKGIQENNSILDVLQESGFFSQREDAPLFSKHKNNFFDYQKVIGFKENGVGILGLPFDACSTGLTGSSNSPNILRRFTSGYMTKTMDIMLTERKYRLLDPVYSVNIYDCGDILYIPGESGDSFHKRIEKAIDYLKDKHGIRKFVSVGGDHSCTLPLIKSLDIENIVFIKFDAHFDNNIK